MRLSRAIVTIADVVAVARNHEPVDFAAVTVRDLTDSRAVVERVLERGNPVYGLNTELGAGRDIVVSPERLEQFQQRTIRNSSGGIGDVLSDEQARAVVFARLAGFTRGGAGVTPALAGRYGDLLNNGPVPVIPRTGSVGAADLTQLAAVAAAVGGALQPHEALAALSSNAYSVGVSALVASDLRAFAPACDVVVALSLSATGGNPSPFDPRIQAAHPSLPQAASAARIAGLFDGQSSSTQDAISFRSAPQVHGPFAAAIERLAAAVELELNSRTENPLVDVESDALISGGNFLVLDLALALDGLRLALGHVAVVSERRLSVISGRAATARRAGETTLPGLLWYSAAGQLAEVRHLASPVSLSGVALSEGVEDHSTNAPLALQLLERSLALTRSNLAIEALSAVELIGLAGAPVSEALRSVVDAIGGVIRSDLSLDDKVEATAQALTEFAASAFSNPR